MGKIYNQFSNNLISVKTVPTEYFHNWFYEAFTDFKNNFNSLDIHIWSLCENKCFTSIVPIMFPLPSVPIGHMVSECRRINVYVTWWRLVDPVRRHYNVLCLQGRNCLTDEVICSIAFFALRVRILVRGNLDTFRICMSYQKYSLAFECSNLKKS